MGLRALARLIFRKLGVGGVMILIGVLGIIFAVRDSAKNMPGHMSFDFKTDLAAAFIGIIGGAAALFIQKKLNEKKAKAHREAENAAAAEAERRARSDPNYYSKPKVSPENAALKSISDRALNALPDMPCLSLFPEAGEPDLFASKLGGTPYMPKNFIYPVGRTGIYRGRPLRLLCQLNFEELPHVEGFPEKGILQFFCSCGDEEAVYGLGTDRDGWRVIYHENIITDMSMLKSAEDIPKFDKGEDFPFKGQFVLKAGKLFMCRPTAADIRFEREFIKAYNDVMGTKITFLDVYEGKFADGQTVYDMYDAVKNSLTCIGGYPDFTQQDPRTPSDDRRVLLFQLESQRVNGREIMWGDMGVGNFFISPEDLKNRDFSRVLFNWDCC
ncbi:MAG: YwqG family protein [Ruminococcus sp.]|nr:YwqG family protein [Ruminococcus sp.]